MHSSSACSFKWLTTVFIGRQLAGTRAEQTASLVNEGFYADRVGVRAQSASRTCPEPVRFHRATPPAGRPNKAAGPVSRHPFLPCHQFSSLTGDIPSERSTVGMPVLLH